MPLPAPKPVEALRQHTRAVVLISSEGETDPRLLDAIRDSEIACELIGHPLVAMAELVRLEQDNRHGEERTALFVADDERIEQLAALFQAVRVRLPQVSIWVIAGDLAVQVQRGSASTARAASPAAVVETLPARSAVRSAPQLRIVQSDAHRPLSGAGPEIDRAQRAVGKLDDKSGVGESDAENDAESDDVRASESETHSTSLTAEELDMLLGFGDEEDPAGGGPGDGGRR